MFIGTKDGHVQLTLCTITEKFKTRRQKEQKQRRKDEKKKKGESHSASLLESSLSFLGKWKTEKRSNYCADLKQARPKHL